MSGMTNYGYAVLTINQASQHGEQLDGPYMTLAEAKDICADMADETSRAGRADRHIVCELIGVED